jgi:hypothetical protein
MAPNATAILAADLHLREDAPPCRTDDFLGAQERKLAFLRGLQQEHGDCPVLVAGDVFHHWKPSPWLLRLALQYTHNWVCVPGQHDLPQHSIAHWNRSGLAVLAAAGCCRVLTSPHLEPLPPPTGWERRGNGEVGVVGFPWGSVEPGPISAIYGHNVALVHRLVYADAEPFPGAEFSGYKAKRLLEQMEGFDLVLCGDNHQQFVACRDGRGKFNYPNPLGTRGKVTADHLLVNPGSFTRQTAAQVDHHPAVFLWWADENRVEREPLPHEKGVISREHVDAEREKDERMSAFVKRLADDYEVGLSFRLNLKRFLAANSVSKETEQLVWELVEGGEK